MERTLHYQITEAQHNKTIRQILEAYGFPHQVIVRLKKTPEGILRNGVWSHVNEKLNAGDSLTLHIVEEPAHSAILPVRIPLDILYEDEDLMVINKPAGMPVHPSMNHHEGTLANGLMYYFQSQGRDFTFRCINRLDRDTSGLTIIAKHLLSGGILSRDVSERNIHRDYLAIVKGCPPDAGTIDAPIARVDGSTIERCVDPATGERAVTHFTRIAYDREKDLSLVRLNLETGRTHQIRVHMKHLGTPIIGDFLYHPDFTYCSRQALHSASLDFIHPVTKEKMHLASPLPDDLKCIFPDF